MICVHKETKARNNHSNRIVINLKFKARYKENNLQQRTEWGHVPWMVVHSQPKSRLKIFVQQFVALLVVVVFTNEGEFCSRVAQIDYPVVNIGNYLQKVG
jgi:hypothetical protein